MDYKLDEQHEMLRHNVRDFCKKEFPREYIRKIDAKKEFPYEAWEKMAKIGLLGTCVPEKYGGAGGGTMHDVIIMEELARVYTSLTLVYSITNWINLVITRFGTEEQKQMFLPKIAEGKMKFAFSLTEPSGGTDALSLSTYAEEVGDKYVINGQKQFTSLANVADSILLAVRTIKNPPKKHHGITLFLVPANSAGLKIVTLDKIANYDAPVCSLFLDDVQVPKSSMVGELNNGWKILLSFMNHERVGCGAMSLGSAEAAFEIALEYAKQRTAFGRPIGQFQAMQRYIAEMATSIELTRLLVYKTAWMESNGIPCEMEAVMSKMVGTETAANVTTRGMDILGGYGLIVDYDMQRYFRDARQFTFAPLTNEVCRLFIAERLGLPKSY
jgi:acyl-CoA dehydrogenase